VTVGGASKAVQLRESSNFRRTRVRITNRRGFGNDKLSAIGIGAVHSESKTVLKLFVAPDGDGQDHVTKRFQEWAFENTSSEVEVFAKFLSSNRYVTVPLLCQTKRSTVIDD